MLTSLLRIRDPAERVSDSGMTMTGRIIRDAWVFGLLPEGDGYAGHSAADMQRLYDQVHEAWAAYGQQPSRLPPELAARHARIHREANHLTGGIGWRPNMRDVD